MSYAIIDDSDDTVLKIEKGTWHWLPRTQVSEARQWPTRDKAVAALKQLRREMAPQVRARVADVAVLRTASPTGTWRLIWRSKGNGYFFLEAGTNALIRADHSCDGMNDEVRGPDFCEDGPLEVLVDEIRTNGIQGNISSKGSWWCSIPVLVRRSGQKCHCGLDWPALAWLARYLDVPLVIDLPVGRLRAKLDELEQLCDR